VSKERIIGDSQRLLLAYLDDPVVVVSPKGRVAYFNPAFGRSFEKELQGLVGASLAKSLPGWMARKILAEAAELAARPQPKSFWLRGEGRRYRVSAAPIVFERRYLGAVVTLWDAGPEMARRRQNFELFRFMLNDLGAQADATDDKGQADPVREGLQRLRDFSELFFGEVHPEAGLFQPDRLLALTIKSMRLRAEERKVALEESVTRDLPRVKGDAGLLSRVLALLTDYMIHRAGRGQLVVLAADIIDGRVGSRLAYSVTGLGVVEVSTAWLSQQADVPADYARLSDQQKNFGLRLIMAKRLVQAMDGRIELAAHESVGTTISLQVPVEVIEAEEMTSDK